mmetsp:Transcript_95052/g.165074  ORF Transcript_95052/g.165074 Transcript_95052/m.165074 type:complete len:151 (-) Transcript_95052:154-606(-)
MTRVALLLACLACAGQARQVPADSQSEALASLLLALNPDAAFNANVKPSGDMVNRRAALGAAAASVLAAFPLAANSMIVPGLNSPGLVKAKPNPKRKPPTFVEIRESPRNHFWNDRGILTSVPRIKGIVTPKSVIYSKKEVKAGIGSNAY